MRNTLILMLILFSGRVLAQPSWHRSEKKEQLDVALFHISQMPDLPTTETLQKGSYMYEISHRFGSINSGYEGMYGFDGPVTMRMALSIGLTDRLMATIGRSNIQDNLDLRLKYKMLQFRSDRWPSVIALQAGMAMNTETYAGIEQRDAYDGNNTQFYGQLIFNTMFFDKTVGLGIVPSVVYNSFIFANEYEADKKYTASLPIYGQYYFNRMWSVWAEYMPVIGGWKGNIFYAADASDRSYNSLSTGVAIETGGHVFYLFATNNTRLNPTQFLVGAPASSSEKDAWRIAFGITRELH